MVTEEEINKIKKQITDLYDQLDVLQRRRITQQDFLPGVVKNRFMSEANSYVYDLDSSDLPTSGNSVQIGTDMRYESDSKKLKIWNRVNGDWDEVQLS